MPATSSSGARSASSSSPPRSSTASSPASDRAGPGRSGFFSHPPGSVIGFGTHAGTALLTSEIEAAFARLRVAGATTLVLLTYPPRASHSDQVVTTTLDRTLPPKLNRFFREVAAKHPSDVIVVDLASIVCPGGWPCPEFVDGIRPRPRDGGHFEGARRAWLASMLVNAVAKGLRHAATAAP